MWFSRNTVYNVTVYLLMRIARSTPASADEPIYLLPRSTGPNRKPRSRRPIGVQPGNMRGDPIPCVYEGRIERPHTSMRRVFLEESCAQHRNDVTAFLQWHGRRYNSSVLLSTPSTIVALGPPKLQGYPRYQVPPDLSRTVEQRWLATSQGSSAKARRNLTPQLNEQVGRIISISTDTKCAELPRYSSPSTTPGLAGGWWLSWHLPSQNPCRWLMNENRTTFVGLLFIRGSLLCSTPRLFGPLSSDPVCGCWL